jgi:hypothetical protein
MRHARPQQVAAIIHAPISPKSQRLIFFQSQKNSSKVNQFLYYPVSPIKHSGTFDVSQAGRVCLFKKYSTVLRSL